MQHHTIQHRSTLGDENTPEWKRRLARGEDIGGDGCDLFGPTRLEGIFKQPAPQHGKVETIAPSTTELARPWSMPDQYQSMRISRARIPEMEVLAEEDEEELDHDTVGPDGGSTRKRALRGVVRDRVLSLEHNSVVSSPLVAHPSSLHTDPRMRTSSGQAEIQNEGISPITTSRQNTIREQALKRLTEAPGRAYSSKPEEVAERPWSRSSDDGVLYGHDGGKSGDFGEITSLSLPEDLSMGTQDFATRGGFVNSRRGGRSNEGSFQRKTLSPSIAPSLEQSINDPTPMPFQSSPPPYPISSRPSPGPPKSATAASTTPGRPQDSDNTDRPRSSGSPLKLFGNYDTFTNNKLLRRMSQFEQDDAEDGSDNDRVSHELENPENMRISHFGKGELDKFTFKERMERMAVRSSSPNPGEAPIFDSSAIRSNGVQRIDVREGPNRNAQVDTEQGTSGSKSFAGESKRVPSSSIGDRTPKRRRKLPQSEIDFTQEAAGPDANSSVSQATQLASKKRKDALHDPAGSAADPATLASRQMLRPRPPLRRASAVVTPGGDNEDRRSATARSGEMIAEGLAGELASFAIGVTQTVNDSRKPSVTTQDFLNEATKIMQIIRQRGKPKSGLSSVEEPPDDSEIGPDSILDLDIEGEDTTVDNFSRPPSRNGSMKVRTGRMAPPDPSVVSHLQKYRDGDDLDLLITSKLGSLHLPPDPGAQQAALVSLPEDDGESEENLSSPGKIRIREGAQHEGKRKHSTSAIDGHPSLPTHASSGTSTGTTIPTCSSASSGNKGRIPPGMVLVPEQVGVMTFDHSTKSWIRGTGQKAASPSSRQTNSEVDPFGDIPDLSIDEQKEAERNALLPREVEFPETRSTPLAIVPVVPSQPRTRDEGRILPFQTTRGETRFIPSRPSTLEADTQATSCAAVDSESGLKAPDIQLEKNEIHTDHEEEVEHEIRIHDGRASEAPPSPDRLSKKARAVTIAFSSPLVSAVAYHNEYMSPEAEHSVKDDGAEEETSASSFMKPQSSPSRTQPSSSTSKPGPSFSGRGFVGRPVSRIDEQDEDNAGHDLSVVHFSQPHAMTPAKKCSTTGPVTHGKVPSMICLTPLSEFSLHQTDRPRHLETSYVAQRTHPTSLQQAHGSLTLAVDELMKAITDTEPYELHWEHIRRLDLTDKRLTSLHRLEEYCSATEELWVSGNQLSQLTGVPISVRTLLAQNNYFSSLTSWAHLRNLHYLDISGNLLESLDGLSCLTHLRELKASNNRIRNLDGILDLNGLLHLELQGNGLTTVDFEGGELTRLHHLDLSNNQLAAVKNVDTLPALRALYLEKNNLREFGVCHETYPMLRDLRLSFNLLRMIDLAVMPSIEVVYLDNNRIETIQGLSTARHLNTLSVREQSDSPNLLNGILSTSNECRKIYLSSNPAPPEGLRMSSLPHLNLKYLELASCGLTTLPADFGKKIPNCRTLNLNFNAVKDIQPVNGCSRLNKLMMVGNRLNKLRRTCTALTRLPALTKVDLRDNPLTVGFYPPFWDRRLVVRGSAPTHLQDQYALPSGDPALDSRWVLHLDEGTRMKRRTIELFLAKGCQKLIELDGLAFDRAALLRQDEIWQKLTSMGVIAKASSTTMSSVHDLQGREALPP